MAVKEEFRGKEIGTILIDYISDYAVKSGISELSISVERSNIKAHKLYFKKRL
ncbi:GNAT family N-acetyltransferase [Anaerocolumna sedimenticola]|uniref:GNAT family N-acetyltransferase n=1 Tax=Anaerocolumna sedimenticola TaxID=2696063 RepID=A0A6P1TU89_9FIRM|nr:GNAT family N-acetyltransferase [Anaerocolumna sedimenticola]